MKFALAFDFSQFERDLVEENRKLIVDGFNKALPIFEKEVKTKISATIKRSSEYRSLVNPRGHLKIDFGLGDKVDTGEGIMNPSSAMKEVINLVLEDVKIKINGRRSKGDFVVSVDIMLLNDLDSIINSPAGSYISYNKDGEASRVDWLKWLLTSGGGPVVIGYHVTYTQSSSSRTGYALMGKGGNFAVDPRFAGTPNNNFIVNSVKKFQEEELSDLIDIYLINALK